MVCWNKIIIWHTTFIKVSKSEVVDAVGEEEEKWEKEWVIPLSCASKQFSSWKEEVEESSTYCLKFCNSLDL